MFFPYNAEESRWRSAMRSYRTARAHLLAFALLTLYSAILVCVTRGTHTPLFSAFTPYYMVLDGLHACGLLNPAFYPPSARHFVGTAVLAVELISALLLILLYLLCWRQTASRPARGWLYLATALLSADTAHLLLLGGLANVVGFLRLAVHAWMLYQMAQGLRAATILSSPPAWTADLLPEDLR